MIDRHVIQIDKGGDRTTLKEEMKPVYEMNNKTRKNTTDRGTPAQAQRASTPTLANPPVSAQKEHGSEQIPGSNNPEPVHKEAKSMQKTIPLAITISLTILSLGCQSTNTWITQPQHTLPPLKNVDHLRDYAATRGFTAGTPRSIKITPAGDAVLFLRSGPRSFEHDLYEFNPNTGSERVLLTAEAILNGAEENLSADERARRERMRLTARGISGYRLSDDGQRILVTLSGKLFVIERTTGNVTELHSDAGYPISAQFSPDAKKITCVRNGDLYLINIANNNETRLTTRKKDAIKNGLSEFVAQEEMGRMHGYWWSPDSTQIVYQQTDTSQVETLYIADATHPEKAPRPWPYPRPGKNNADVRLAIMSVSNAAKSDKGGDPIWINWDRNNYPYLAKVTWTRNAPLTLLVQNRRQTEEKLLTVNLQTGETRTLLTESDAAWVNLDHTSPKWLPDGSAFFWMSEHSGTRQLELRDRNGNRIRTLTPKGFTFGGITHFDEKTRHLWFYGSDIPTERHIYTTSIDDPAQMTRLTTTRGMHGYTIAKSGTIAVHTFATLDGRQGNQVLRADGTMTGTLQSKAEQPPSMPKIELTTVGNLRKFQAMLIRPDNFDPEKQYPVVVYVYGGPGHRVVQADPRKYLRQQWIADQGFIVVSFDGRGTPGRGRAWERVTKFNVIDLPLKDQIEALTAMGKQYPELDLTRVGIYGWSFGGYFSAMAVMRAPDTFHVGVAGAPVADWRDYDTHYTERFMGLPDENAEGYRTASVLTHAKDLRRPLLIIHGTADDNVYFMHSLKMSEALFTAGRAHTFLPLSNFTHMVPDPNTTIRLYERIVRFLQQALTGE